MKVDVLQNSKDVFTVYMDIVGGVSRAMPIGPDHEPPEGGFPNTFIGLKAVQEAFPGCELNIVGPQVEENTKLAQGPSQKEFDEFVVNLRKKEAEVDAKLLNPPKQERSDCSTLLLVFEQKIGEYRKSTRKKKELAKAYCNGMGRAIKMIFPEVESRLKEIIEGNKEEEDLL